jgi:hypothetical protein
LSRTDGAIASRAENHSTSEEAVLPNLRQIFDFGHRHVERGGVVRNKRDEVDWHENQFSSV